MSDYYYDYNSGSKSTQPTSGWLMIVDIVMTLLSAVVVVVSMLTLLVPYISPAHLGVLPILALTAQWVYVAAVVMMLYWIIRWRWWRAAVMIVVVVTGVLYVDLYYKVEMRRLYEEPRYERSALRIMSYNLRSFYSDDGEFHTVDSVAQFIRKFNPDIVCLQEYSIPSKYRKSYIDSLFARYNVAVVDKSLGQSISPLAIMSKHRILRSRAVMIDVEDSLPPRSRAMWADIIVGKDTVRVFNVHLNSTSIKSEDQDYITNYRYMSDTARNTKILDMVRRLNENTVSRSLHVDTLASVMASTHTAKILCGDFNDTPMSYAYHTLSRDMQDAFSESGRGRGYTFRGFFNTLRIDFALLSDRFEVLSYDAPDSVKWSDHLPVCVRAKIKQIDR